MLKLTSKICARLYAKGLKGHCLNLYFWLYNKKIVGKKVTIYYSDFVKWFKNTTRKEEGSISNRQASRCFHDLHRLGFAEVTPRGFGRFEIILFDLYLVLGLKSEDSTKMPGDKNPQDEVPAYSPTQKSITKAGYQQQLILAKQLINSVGVNYREKKVWGEMLSYGIEKIEATVNWLKCKLSRKHTPIDNLPGLFRSAIQNGYYLDDPSPPSLIDNLTRAIVTFL